MKPSPDQHPLIDGYLKKHWFWRLMLFLAKTTVFLSLLGLTAFVVWQRAPTSFREEWQGRFPVLENVPVFQELVQAEQQPVSPGRPFEEAKDPPLADSSRQKTGLPTEASLPTESTATEPREDNRAESGPDPWAGIADGDSRVRRAENFKAREGMDIPVPGEALLKNGGLAVRWLLYDPKKPISWLDFRMDADLAGKYGCGISTWLRVEYNGRDWTAFAVMIPEMSWVRGQSMNTGNLRYVRLKFAIAELFARKMRAAIAQNHRDDIPMLRDGIWLEMRAMQRKLMETSFGKPENLAQWEDELARGLEHTSGYIWHPDPQDLADQGFKTGYFILAQAYHHGIMGLESSAKMAEKWYKISINRHEFNLAINNLAVLYQNGQADGQPNVKKALQMYNRASRQKDPFAFVAQFNAGIVYWHGLQGKAKPERAMDLFKTSSIKMGYANEALRRMARTGEVQPN